VVWFSGQRERSVKPSAQPTLVRTQHLPPPAETAPWLRKRARGAVFVLVTSRIRVCHCASRCRGVHGRIADVVRAGCAVGDTVGFPRTATDGPGKRGLAPAQVWCRCHAPPDGRHRPGRAGAAAAEGRAVRQTVASAARRVSGQLLYWRGCPSRTVLTEPDSPRPARRSPSSLPIRAPSQMPGVTSLCTPREPALEDNQPWHSGARVLGHAASTMVIRRAERAAGCRPS
jgi:hypothetical protein